MILRFILWWISRPRSLYETEMVYWKVRKRMLTAFPYMHDELNADEPIIPIYSTTQKVFKSVDSKRRTQ